MEIYFVWMLLIGVAFLGAAWLPYLIKTKPLSFPMIYVAFGAAAFSLWSDLKAPDLVEHVEVVERLTELVVIVSLMGVGLKLDRRVSLRLWSSTWRLLGITMPLCIGAFALVGWSVLGLAPAGAVLLGAVLAPTDPVLAAEIQASPPQEGEDNEIRFGLTSESGLNDGLAFPFTNLALAVAAAGHGAEGWLQNWFWDDVVYKLVVGTIAGMVLGYALAWIVFRVRLTSPMSVTGEGIAAIAITLITYSVTEIVHGYGFLAVFVAALMIRRHERDHEYHRALHQMAENIERLLMAGILVLFGGALATGLLDALTWRAALVAVVFILIVRPVAGWVGMIGRNIPWQEKGAIAFFGIRGVGSFYYLAYAFHREAFPDKHVLWSLVGFVVLLSIFIHGLLATPIMRRVES